jgi:hypothetical protein
MSVLFSSLLDLGPIGSLGIGLAQVAAQLLGTKHEVRHYDDVICTAEWVIAPVQMELHSIGQHHTRKSSKRRNRTVHSAMIIAALLLRYL